MKLFLYAVLCCTISGCCLMGTKCDPSETGLLFKVVRIPGGEDLVFGPSKIYHSDSIKFYSLRGKDTISHFYRPEFDLLVKDSVLSVNIDVANNEPVFVRLSSADIDTLHVIYRVRDGGRCCGDIRGIDQVMYNNSSMYGYDGIQFIMKKN